MRRLLARLGQRALDALGIVVDEIDADEVVNTLRWAQWVQRQDELTRASRRWIA